MGHFRALGLFGLALFGLFALAGCGGSSSSSSSGSVGTVTTVTLTPNPSVSLTSGDVLQMQILAQDSAGKTVFNQTPTFTTTMVSGPANAIQISNSGLLCGGTWDSLVTPIVCTPAATGTAGIEATIKATVQGVASNSVNAFIHLPVTRVVIGNNPSPSGASCNVAGLGIGVPQNGQLTYTAQAFDGNTDITASVGSFSWRVVDTSVAEFGLTVTGAVNTAQAKLPGVTQVIATTNNANPVNSVPATFIECPVANITITPSSIAFTAAGNLQSLTATVTDTTGSTVTGASLTWTSSQPAVATIGVQGTALAVAAGSTTFVASCTPNACNTNLPFATYSNGVIGTVPGSAASTAYVAGTASTNLIPITGNTAGTAIALPNLPNSLVFAPSGGQAFLGSDAGMMIINATNNTVANTISNMPGRVLAVSPDSNVVLVADSANNTVTLLNQNGNSVQSFSIATAPNAAAGFTPDSLHAYLASGTSVYTIQSGVQPSAVAASAATSLSILANGTAVFLADSGTPFISTCDDTLVTGPGGSPSLVQSLADGSQMLGADSPNLDVIAVSLTSGSCPPSASAPVTTNLGTAFTPRQFIVTPDGKHVYLTSDAPGVVLGYDVGNGTSAPVSLSTNAATFTGGVTVDSANVFVGGSDSQVHRIDVATGQDVQAFPIGFIPDLVAVRP